MNKKRTFTFLALFFGFSLCFSKETTLQIANRLFIELAAVPSMVDQNTFDDLFKKITFECSKKQCLKDELVDSLIDICNKNLLYYESLIKGNESNYKNILYSFGGSLLLVALVYGIYTVAQNTIRNNAQEIKITKNKLCRLGAGLLYVNDGRAYALCNQWSGNIPAIKKKLRHLAYLSNHSTMGFTITNFILTLMALALGICGTSDLLDQIYATFYYEKYCFIKDEIEKRRESP